MNFKKKNPKRVRVLLKKPRPDPRPDPYKNPVPKITKIPLYIYTYNLTLTNPSFLQSSIFSSSGLPPSADTQSLSLISAQSAQLSPHSPISTVLSPISAVTPHASLSLTQSCLTPHAIAVRSAQSRPLSVTLSLSFF